MPNALSEMISVVNDAKNLVEHYLAVGSRSVKNLAKSVMRDMERLLHDTEEMIVEIGEIPAEAIHEVEKPVEEGGEDVVNLV